MNKDLLDPKVDFGFKYIFGSTKHPEILISFLNATLKPKKKIVSVDIKKTMIHSDQGCHYTSCSFIQLVKDRGLRQVDVSER